MRTALPALYPNGNGSNAEITTATRLTFAAGTDVTVLQALVSNIIYTVDGTTPTATNGYVMYVGQEPLMFEIAAGMPITVLHAAAGARLQKNDMKYVARPGLVV